MVEVAFSIFLLTGIIMVLVVVVVAARRQLVESGDVSVTVNGQRVLKTPVGEKLLSALAEQGIYLPAACGGRGTCGQCRITVLGGGGAILAVETARISKREANQGQRLACQLVVKQHLDIQVPDEILGAREIDCRVRSAQNVATLIREIVLELAAGQEFDFHAGNYVQVHSPPFHARFADFSIEADYVEEWQRLRFFDYNVNSRAPTTRAYSMANYPGESGIIMLNVRIALPPHSSPTSIPPGVVSSYLFSLKQGDTVRVSGPFGYFYANDSEAEMIFIGGGAGMAPLRALILDQLERLNTSRRISFWYGARSRRELFYSELFDGLAVKHDNFDWRVALSEPRPEDEWTGTTGFIHDAVYENYLKDHPEPEDCEYYLCGPPLMIKAVTLMLANLGVEEQNIRYDDFGG